MIRGLIGIPFDQSVALFPSRGDGRLTRREEHGRARSGRRRTRGGGGAATCACTACTVSSSRTWRNGGSAAAAPGTCETSCRALCFWTGFHRLWGPPRCSPPCRCGAGTPSLRSAPRTRSASSCSSLSSSPSASDKKSAGQCSIFSINRQKWKQYEKEKPNLYLKGLMEDQ